MQLYELSFVEHEGSPQEWSLEGLTLNSKNLIVGKNASGKTRTINVIGSLARNLAGLQPPGMSSKYNCYFRHDNQIYHYMLSYDNDQVTHEELQIDQKTFLKRGEGGFGTIYSEKIDGGKHIDFQAPTSEFAAVARRDSIQHSFLEPLYSWADAVRQYYFGTNLGKDLLSIFQPGGKKLDDRDQNAVAAVFRHGALEFQTQFSEAIIRDLEFIDYHVESVDISTPISIRLSNIEGLPSNPYVLCVKEKDLPGITDQFSMSQGMFRVLSLLIHINYCEFKKKATCILIDDIGEGLDFDRSCRLIELLRKKAENSNLQLIMSTNDRFIMNGVPLDEWSVLQRTGNHVQVRNYKNSKEIFDDFKFTGLSNFSFLELDVLNNENK